MAKRCVLWSAISACFPLLGEIDEWAVLPATPGVAPCPSPGGSDRHTPRQHDQGDSGGIGRRERRERRRGSSEAGKTSPWRRRRRLISSETFYRIRLVTHGKYFQHAPYCRISPGSFTSDPTPMYLGISEIGFRSRASWAQGGGSCRFTRVTREPRVCGVRPVAQDPPVVPGTKSQGVGLCSPLTKTVSIVLRPSSF